MADLSRRALLGALAAAVPPIVPPAAQPHAQPRPHPRDTVAIGWPNDVPGWDPNRRFMPDAQSLYKMLFDQPLNQDPRLHLVPGLARAWQLAPDAMSLAVDLRDDVTFHDGTKLTSADFRWTFHERIAAGHPIDTARSWRKVIDIDTPSPTRAIMRFASPAATAPAWLAFLGSFIVPKGYMQKVGLAAFGARPVGTGPYRLAEHQPGTRIVLERNDTYWGPKPAMRRVTVQIINDPAARAAAIQSGSVDLTIAVPVHEVARLGAIATLEAELNPITRIILLQVRHDAGFTDRNIRLAAHHAIDKQALSQAFYGNAAVPLSVPAIPGSPGFPDDFTFPHDPDMALELLSRSGYSPASPARIRIATTRGQFPADYEIARAIIGMWKKVGIEAALEVLDYARYFELNRAGRLPEATLYSFDNAIGDPEASAGHLLDPHQPHSPWQGTALGQKMRDLFDEPAEAARIAGWQALNREAVEIGACMPLLRSMQTLVRRKDLAYSRFGNGWVLPQTMDWI